MEDYCEILVIHYYSTKDNVLYIIFPGDIVIYFYAIPYSGWKKLSEKLIHTLTIRSISDKDRIFFIYPIKDYYTLGKKNDNVSVVLGEIKIKVLDVLPCIISRWKSGPSSFAGETKLLQLLEKRYCSQFIGRDS